MNTPPPHWGPQNTEFSANEEVARARITESRESFLGRTRGLNLLALLGVAIVLAFVAGLGWRLVAWLLGAL